MNQNYPCLVCGKDDNPVVRVGIRENPEWPVYQCTACGIQYIEPPFADPQKYYSYEYRKEHNPVPFAEMTAQERYDYYAPLMPKRLPHFREHVPAGRTVLEVGCSAGHYLELLAKNGYEARGCDYNTDDVEYVNKVLRIPCEVGDIDTAFPNKRFGAICAYHVFEHVLNPVEWVKSAYDRLKSGGILYVQVPNLRDALISLYDLPEFAQRWYREPHLTYWTAEAIQAVFEGAGLETTISYDQLYSLGNHFSWHLTKKPMPEASVAQTPMVLHESLANVFQYIDDTYRMNLIERGIADCLIAVGRKP